MKLRIKGNTLRLRLSKSEVDYFEKTNYLEEQTAFIENKLSYALRADETKTLTATFENNKIIVHMPFNMAKDWTKNTTVGFSSEVALMDNKKLFLLVEKDFKCLDETIEDQSDNYENPLAAGRS